MNNLKYQNIFGFIFSIEKLRSLEIESLKEYFLNLECSFKYNDNSDTDELDLFSELKVLRQIIHVENSTQIDILNYIVRPNSFPNAIVLMIPVSVASTKRSFSKLKLIKPYL